MGARTAPLPPLMVPSSCLHHTDRAECRAPGGQAGEAAPASGQGGGTSSSSSSSSDSSADACVDTEEAFMRRASPASTQSPEHPSEGDMVGLVYDNSMELHRGPGAYAGVRGPKTTAAVSTGGLRGWRAGSIAGRRTAWLRARAQPGGSFWQVCSDSSRQQPTSRQQSPAWQQSPATKRRTCTHPLPLPTRPSRACGVPRAHHRCVQQAGGGGPAGALLEAGRTGGAPPAPCALVNSWYLFEAACASTRCQAAEA